MTPRFVLISAKRGGGMHAAFIASTQIHCYGSAIAQMASEWLPTALPLRLKTLRVRIHALAPGRGVSSTATPQVGRPAPRRTGRLRASGPCLWTEPRRNVRNPIW